MAQTVNTSSGDASVNVLLGVLLVIIIVGLLLWGMNVFGRNTSMPSSSSGLSGNVNFSLPTVPGVTR